MACCAPTTHTVALLTFYEQSWHYKTAFSPLTMSIIFSCWKFPALRGGETLTASNPDSKLCWLKAKAKTHLEVKEQAHSFSSFSASPLSGLKPRPMAPISECGRPADRLVNIHEKATSLMIPTCSERWRGQRKWPLTGHRET